MYATAKPPATRFAALWRISVPSCRPRTGAWGARFRHFPRREIRQAEAAIRWSRGAAPGIQVAAGRRRAGPPVSICALGGHNAESHNHNDVGNFVVYLDGNPVLIDVGVESYTAKTFSSKRYEIWTMQSAFHNLPTINGVMQAAGRQYEARDVSFHADDAAAEFSADLAAAYPKEAAVEKWRRTVCGWIARPTHRPITRCAASEKTR